MTVPHTSCRILLVDDHPLVRDGLRAALRHILTEPTIEEAGTAQEALAKADAFPPHLILLDVHLPDFNGLELARRLRGKHPEVRLLMVAGEADAWTVRECLAAGADGFMAKTNAAECLARAVTHVLAGEEFLCPDSRKAVDKVAQSVLSDDALPSPAVLSQREREVLRFFAHGENTKEIAALLGISVKTVETHRQHIARKLGTASIATLTRYAIRHGLVQP